MANLNITARLQDEASASAGQIAESVGSIEKEASIASRGFSALQSIGTAALGAIVVGVVAAVAALATFTAGGIKMAMDMEAQMSSIAAVLGETRQEIEPLGDLIADLGLNPNLKVTAEEAATAIETLATAGLTMTEIVEGAAEATVLLANATGGTFDQAAAIAADSMAIFNIEAADMMDAVNGITSVTIASKFGINDYALALAQAGGVASSVGVGFDDFNTAITAISPLFASGSDAGTSFKTMLTRLVPGSEAAAEAMVDLNLIVSQSEQAMQQLRDLGIEPTAEQMRMLDADFIAGLEGLDLTERQMESLAQTFMDTAQSQNMFFDAEGNMKSMAEIAGLMEDAFAGLSEEQRSEAMSTIFGSDAMRAAVGLMETGEEGFREMAATMGQTDAMEQAAVRMDNLSGKIEIMKGIASTAQLMLGQAFLPVLTMLADNLLGVANNALPAITAGLEQLSTWLTTTGEAIAAGGLVQLFTVFEDGSTRLENLFAIFGMGEVQARNLAVSIIELVNQGVSLITWISQAVGSFVTWQDVLMAIGIAIAAVVIPALIGIVTAAAPVIAVAALLIGGIALLRTAWEQDWGGIQEKTATAVAFIQGIITSVLTAVQTFWAQNGARILASAQAVWTGIQTAISTAINTVQAIVTAVYTAVQSFWASNGSAILTIATAVWAGVQNAIQTAITTVRAIITSVMTAVQSFWSAHGETITTVARKTWEGIQNWISAAVENIQLIIQAISQAIEGDWRGFGETLREIANNAWETIKQAISTGVENIKAIVAELIQVVVNLFTTTDWPALGQGIIDGIAGAISAGVGAITEAARGVARAALDAAMGFLGISSPSTVTAEKIGKPIIEGVILGMERSGPFIPPVMEDIILGGVLDGMGRSGPFIPPIVEDVITGGILDGIGGSGPFIPPAVEDVFTKGVEDGITAVDAVEIGGDLGAALIDSMIASIEAGADESATIIEGLFDLGSQLSSIGGGFGRLFQERELDPLEGQISGFESAIDELLSGPLQGAMSRFGATSLQDLVDVASMFSGAFTGAELNALAEAVALENARTEAAAEYAAMQERLLELQQQQQDLQFLQNQLDLLRLITEHGLDPAAVLGGMELGLDASLPDLLAAMTAAMQAIITQAEGELGIGSPSRVFENIMRQVGVGAVSGLDIARSMVSDAAVSVSDALLQPFTTSTAPLAASADTDNGTETRPFVIYGGLHLHGVQDKDSLLEELEAFVIQ